MRGKNEAKTTFLACRIRKGNWKEMCLKCEAEKLNVFPSPTRTLLAAMMIQFYEAQEILHEHGVSSDALIDSEVRDWQDTMRHVLMQGSDRCRSQGIDIVLSSNQSIDEH